MRPVRLSPPLAPAVAPVPQPMERSPKSKDTVRATATEKMVPDSGLGFRAVKRILPKQSNQQEFGKLNGNWTI